MQIGEASPILEDEDILEMVNAGLIQATVVDDHVAELWEGVFDEIGLDPNRWFGNVEVGTAREIGHETVQYVSNILKYYVSYTLLTQQWEEWRPAQ